MMKTWEDAPSFQTPGGNEMAAKSTDTTPFLKAGKEQTDAMLGVQKELLEAYEQASRAWLARVKSEMDLWSEVGAKLAAARSAPEAMSVYQECVGQRMQMAAEDGRRLFDECQKITQKITRSASNGWPTGST
jgi:Phasin protein